MPWAASSWRRRRCPVLLARGGGSLFFTGASGSLRGKANFAPFASAKAALRNLAQSVAREFGPQGVHVGHVVVDGGIGGDRLLSRMPQLKDQRGPDGLLDIDAIAEAYWVHAPSAPQRLDPRAGRAPLGGELLRSRLNLQLDRHPPACPGDP